MNTLEKAKWISVLILIILLLALAALGVWQLHLANERLLSLKERAAGLSDRVIQPSPEPEPEAGSTPPAPTSTAKPLPVNPNEHTTRAAFAAKLAAFDNADLSDFTVAPFMDVLSVKWYAAAVAWAADTSIVTGVGNNKFAPDERITREQIALMLYNYIVYKGYGAPADLSDDYADSNLISMWAAEAVNVIGSMNIFPEKADNTFDPQSGVTNAEVDTILARLAEYSLTTHNEAEYPGGGDLDDYGNWLPPYEDGEASPLPVYSNESIIIPTEGAKP